MERQVFVRTITQITTLLLFLIPTGRTLKQFVTRQYSEYRALSPLGLEANIQASAAKVQYLPQLVNSHSDPCCGIYERPVFLLQSDKKNSTVTAFFALRAHVARN
ncbi:hypothetical protein [Parasphingorhabdus sp.]|uniref:hypothetical protein n=1 Tax=Parasphingorhabdus sp. TaxID=2709688 RepID=UPI003299FE7F